MGEQKPRRDAPQVNLDEMVPDRRTFTQMTALEMGDSTLNRLNQLYATEDAAGEPVRTKDLPDPDPAALRMIKFLLSFACVLSLVLLVVISSGYGGGTILPDFTLALREEPAARICAAVLPAALALRLGIGGVQNYMAHRAWLKKVREGKK